MYSTFRLKVKKLNRLLHTSPGCLFELNEDFDSYNPRRKGNPTKFDWMRINEAEIEELPDMPDIKTYQKEEEYWKKLSTEDFFPTEKETEYKYDDGETNEAEFPYAQVSDQFLEILLFY
jgi:hypothetical protein